MDFFEIIEARHSIRRFDQAVEVPPEAVERLLSAAQLAPNAGNPHWNYSSTPTASQNTAPGTLSAGRSATRAPSFSAGTSRWSNFLTQ